MKNDFLNKIVQKRNITLIISLYASMRVLIPMINGYIKLLGECFNKQYTTTEIYNFLDCIKAIFNNKVIGLIYVIIALIFIFTIYDILFTKKRMKIEKEGVNLVVTESEPESYLGHEEIPMALVTDMSLVN